jgi:hypothetical protein
LNPKIKRKGAAMSKTTNATSTQADTPTQEGPLYGAPTTSTALSMLFETAADHLDADQLAYLAKMDDHAAIHAENLSTHLMELGCFYANVDHGAASGKNQTAETMWMLSHQLDHIRGLIELAAEAKYRLDNPKTEANERA